MADESNRSSSNISEPREEPDTIKKWKAEQVDNLPLIHAKIEKKKICKKVKCNWISAEVSGKEGQAGGGGQGGAEGKGSKGAGGLVCSALGAGEQKEEEIIRNQIQ